MTALDREDLHGMLVRIDERVKAIQEDVREINEARSCVGHEMKIRSLERMVWGCAAGLAGIGARLVMEALK
ncbi:hypothetical protein [Pseudodesulfovibrio sp.]|uniref:hypothetical protein n=1 Tax=unclassified Pseudodesulfovibrio TaxID=2661612 RepID=UPI003AFFD589